MIRLLVFIVALLVAACGDEPQPEAPAEIPIATLPGVYAGQFPCQECSAIPTTLWLRADARFFLKQEYGETEESDAMSVYSFGRWQWRKEDGLLALRGEGPDRLFARPDEDALVMQTRAELEHRLNRDPAAPAFVAVTKMSGTIRLGGDVATFTECLTELGAPLSRGGDYRKFLHQYRSAGAGRKMVFVELEGRFLWAENDSPQTFRIDRFITIKSDGSC